MNHLLLLDTPEILRTCWLGLGFQFAAGAFVKGCYRCGKARCQICHFLTEGDKFLCHVSGREYRINSRFDCDSSGVVSLFGCKVCGVQYVGSTFNPFCNRFNNYKSCARRFDRGELVPQVDFLGIL